MPTLLKIQGFCGYCGQADAPLKCSCNQISCCDEICQEHLWIGVFLFHGIIHVIMCVAGQCYFYNL